MRISLSLIIFELIVIGLLFQLFAWMTLGLAPIDVIWSTLCCSAAVSGAALICGVYGKRGFESLPNMYVRSYLGFALSVVLCVILTNSAFSSVNDTRFTFAFIFSCTIVLTTTRSLFCEWAGTDTSGEHKRRRSMDNPLEN